jgi:uncharacterized protein (DUF2147 family)
MKTLSALFAPLALIAAEAPATAQTGQPATGAVGLWLNPHNSVVVKTGPCGDKLCGWIVWANKEAMSDAKDSGVTALIGTELLQDYRPKGNGLWAGSVYVPDMGHSFSSTIIEMGKAMKVKGCLIGGFICKSQVWQRIEHVPNA